MQKGKKEGRSIIPAPQKTEEKVSNSKKTELNSEVLSNTLKWWRGGCGGKRDCLFLYGKGF